MQISLPLHPARAFGEVDKAECMAGSTCQQPGSCCLGLVLLTMKCVQPNTFGLHMSGKAEVNRLSKREPFLCVFLACNSSCLLFLLFSSLNQRIGKPFNGYNRAGQMLFAFCKHGVLLEARLKYLIRRRGMW